jgi:diadenosine tetraphosphate (Ap4A) HIT family hydrolase
MRTIDFALDPRLQADTRYVASLPLCEVLLMDDARYPWLILVPRRIGMVELLDLPSVSQQALWQEINQVAAALRGIAPCDKLNIGALGNIVRQLHVHVIARKEGDAAWPGPVWGNGRAEPYAKQDLESRIDRLRELLASGDA